MGNGFHSLFMRFADMNRIWHYIKNNEFPEHTCCCLCRVKWQGEYKHVTLHYYDKDDWCCECSGDLVDPHCVEAWADINDILERAYP